MFFCFVLYLQFLVSSFLFCFCSLCVICLVLVFYLYVFPVSHVLLLLSLCFMFQLFHSVSCFYVCVKSVSLSYASSFTLTVGVLCQCILLCFLCLVMSDLFQLCSHLFPVPRCLACALKPCVPSYPLCAVFPPLHVPDEILVFSPWFVFLVWVSYFLVSSLVSSFHVLGFGLCFESLFSMESHPSIKVATLSFHSVYESCLLQHTPSKIFFLFSLSSQREDAFSSLLMCGII